MGKDVELPGRSSPFGLVEEEHIGIRAIEFARFHELDEIIHAERMIFLLVERHIDRVIEALLLGRVVVERLHHDALHVIEEERVEHERHFNTIRSEPGKDRFVVEGIAHVGKIPRMTAFPRGICSR